MTKIPITSFHEENDRDRMETLHLAEMPGMAASIQEAAKEPLNTCVLYDPDEPW